MDQLELVEEKLPTPANDALRHQANTLGVVLLLYKAIMNIAVIVLSCIAILFATIMATVSGFMHGGEGRDMVAWTEDLLEKAMGWGYLLAIGICFVAMLIWKKPDYLRHTIGQKGRPMTPGSFFALLSLAMAPQLIAQLWDLGLRWLLELCGQDPSVLQQMASADADTLSMFLYIGIAAPVAEELLFRGLLLRSIAPYGKKMAILASALLFGLFHANPIQTPYAIAVGLVLGYVALKYHVIWAIVLHLFNNLVFALLLPCALAFLPGMLVDGILWMLIILFFLASVLILAAKWDYLMALWKEEKVEAWQRKAFFHAPAVVILMVLCLLSMVVTTLLLFLL